MSEYGTKDCPICDGLGEMGKWVGNINAIWMTTSVCPNPVCDLGQMPRTAEDHQDHLEYLAEESAGEQKLGH